jgi:hypothetical protein
MDFIPGVNLRQRCGTNVGKGIGWITESGCALMPFPLLEVHDMRKLIFAFLLLQSNSVLAELPQSNADVYEDFMPVLVLLGLGLLVGFLMYKFWPSK